MKSSTKINILLFAPFYPLAALLLIQSVAQENYMITIIMSLVVVFCIFIHMKFFKYSNPQEFERDLYTIEEWQTGPAFKFILVKSMSRMSLCYSIMFMFYSLLFGLLSFWWTIIIATVASAVLPFIYGLFLTFAGVDVRTDSIS